MRVLRTSRPALFSHGWVGVPAPGLILALDNGGKYATPSSDGQTPPL